MHVIFSPFNVISSLSSDKGPANDLPSEMILQVFKFLSLDQSPGPSLVCRSWNQLYKKSSFWKDFCRNTFFDKEILFEEDLQIMEKDPWGYFQLCTNADYAFVEMLGEPGKSVTSLLIADYKLFCGYLDGTIQFWDSKNDKMVSLATEQTAMINHLLIHQGLLVSSSTDSTIKVYDFKNSKLLRTFQLPNFVYATSLEIEDGELIAGCDDGSIVIWDFCNSEEPKWLIFNRHNDSVISCKKMNNKLITGSYNGDIIQHDLKSESADEFNGICLMNLLKWLFVPEEGVLSGCTNNSGEEIIHKVRFDVTEDTQIFDFPYTVQLTLGRGKKITVEGKDTLLKFKPFFSNEKQAGEMLYSAKIENSIWHGLGHEIVTDTGAEIDIWDAKNYKHKQSLPTLHIDKNESLDCYVDSEKNSSIESNLEKAEETLMLGNGKYLVIAAPQRPVTLWMKSYAMKG
jgi:WD40 repeat protein